MSSLGNDLARIRIEQHLSIEDIQGTTKIPTSIISSIENDSIFQNQEINPTYIRSYIRSYAKAVSITEKEILYALNKQAKDDYTGSLQKLLDEPDKEVAEADDKTPKPSATPEKEHAPEELPDSIPKKEPQKESAPPPQAGREAPDINSVDWVALGRKASRPMEHKPKVWIGLVILLLLIVIGLVYYFYYWDNPQTTVEKSPAPTETPAPADSRSFEINPSGATREDTTIHSSTQPAASNQIQSQALNALPDTLTLTVYAAYGKLEPARVYTDIMNSTNPYWIEQGEALRFNFVNEFRIRGAVKNVVLLMNGHTIKKLYEQFYNPDTGFIKITRPFFEGDPKWLQPAPDSLHIDAPAPSVIKNNSTFNDSM